MTVALSSLQHIDGFRGCYPGQRHHVVNQKQPCLLSTELACWPGCTCSGGADVWRLFEVGFGVAPISTLGRWAFLRVDRWEASWVNSQRPQRIQASAHICHFVIILLLKYLHRNGTFLLERPCDNKIHRVCIRWFTWNGISSRLSSYRAALWCWAFSTSGIYSGHLVPMPLWWSLRLRGHVLKWHLSEMWSSQTYTFAERCYSLDL